MAGTSSVLEDNSLLSRLDRALVPVEWFFALISGIAVFSLMFLAVWSVLGRKFFGSPLMGYVDYIETAMPFIAIMGVSYVQRSGGHIRMDMLVGALSGRAKWLFELISVLFILVLIIALIWGSWAHFDRSFDCARPFCSRDSSIDIGLPLWPSKLIVPMAFSVLALRLVLQAWGYARALVLGLENPVAVPLILTVAEQAKLEADALGDD
ncbi:TRAP transporter small permease subunit [Pseudosulfitobacter pseudonitzschiae]|uniref:TRAP transporter small permease subunit n=1 Tax=Pseudosulfitobacter pseudonitzschiae TaxID=1402135 RepID=UPI001AF2DB4F|nr:TRAP transporter small permease [Pseudosulfitobacter pseudonitzschiae]MBM1813579.1 TRAP transporter small permease [Pseudosulfitobacter pseudonitzschiae]MBM1830572.1 TRAP transporter small permease [Pseudosulfitobacter pseudonitzschiae]MBM1835439.1 TRAP transporter small permease [Pseudosulfitobacter pseudonitzschiae]MBM1840285.1 TRAP transporter small permease [Pseudosulfitobacter pseudonitzschiae]MBM1845727.1 TRAP transporter small permease [Pseudosulfitobacter pseudonitzschiae]